MVRSSQMPRLVSLAVMALLIVFLGMTFYKVLAPFLLPLFLAAIVAIMSQPLYKRMVAWTKGRTRLAASLTTGLVLAIILIPLSIGTLSASKQLIRIGQAASNDTDWRTVLAKIRTHKSFLRVLEQYGKATGDVIEPEELQQELQARFGDSLVSLARKTLAGFPGSTVSLIGGAVSAIVGVLTFVLALHYFLADGPTMIESTINLVPVHRDYQRQLIAQFDRAVRGVVSATFAAAAAQGVATGLGMYVAGYQHFFLVSILGTLTAMVPLLGTWLIWGPYALYLGLHGEGNWLGAALLAIYGTVFVGFLDNVIRTWVLHSNVKLHPLLAFVSVLGGIEVMGLWGLFVGPIVASCLYALVQIFNTELVAFAQPRSSPQMPAIVARDDDETEVMKPLQGAGSPARVQTERDQDRAEASGPTAAAPVQTPAAAPGDAPRLAAITNPAAQK